LLGPSFFEGPKLSDQRAEQAHRACSGGLGREGLVVGSQIGHSIAPLARSRIIVDPCWRMAPANGDPSKAGRNVVFHRPGRGDPRERLDVDQYSATLA
jgi:hypothetical protein